MSITTTTITEHAASMVDSVTSPNATVPIIGTAATANWLVGLPEIINILTAVYLVLLVAHKGYNMYKEYKQGSQTQAGKDTS